MDKSVVYEYYYDRVSCIDRQIAELQARKNAILHGYCFTGYHSMKPYMDPYNLVDEIVEEEKK